MTATDRVKRIRRKPAGRFHHGDLKEALVAACVDIVEREGHQAVSLRILAKRVGVTEPAIYRHFANRDALLVEVGQRGLLAFDQALFDAAHAVADPYDAAAALARAYVR